MDDWWQFSPPDQKDTHHVGEVRLCLNYISKISWGGAADLKAQKVNNRPCNWGSSSMSETKGGRWSFQGGPNPLSHALMSRILHETVSGECGGGQTLETQTSKP